MKHEMQVMDPSGHTSIKWNPAKDGEIEIAEAAFKAAKEKGYSAFRVGRFGKKGTRIDAFDPKAKQMILIPQLVGG